MIKYSMLGTCGVLSQELRAYDFMDTVAEALRLRWGTFK